MAVVLGVDSAWTPMEPSGVALLRGEADRWECVAVAPSYEAYLARATGTSIDWRQRRFVGSPPEMKELLRASETLAGTPVDLVAIDMPLSTLPLSSRRRADHQVSVTFGKAWCSAHSPTKSRPGTIGVTVMRQLTEAGYPLVTKNAGLPASQHTIEVYPHPALLALMRTTQRFRYKVQKAKRFWPQSRAGERIGLVLTQFALIDAKLREYITNIPPFLPSAGQVQSLSGLKRYEDALDALICGWVGIECLRGVGRSYGDETAAIWVPALSEELLKVE